MLKTKELEKIIKGCANHRRIEILKLLSSSPPLSVGQISDELRVNFKTVSEHTRRLQLAGLVTKNYKGQFVLHNITPQGKTILKFLRILE